MRRGPRRNKWGGAHRGASIADLDRDGNLDIAYLMDDGYFAVRRGRDGEVLYDLEPGVCFKGKIPGNNKGPVLADLTGDGKLDAFFVIGSGSSQHEGKGVAVCVTGFAGTGKGWPMLRHDKGNSGNFDNAGGFGKFGKSGKPCPSPTSPPGHSVDRRIVRASSTFAKPRLEEVVGRRRLVLRASRVELSRRPERSRRKSRSRLTGFWRQAGNTSPPR